MVRLGVLAAVGLLEATTAIAAPSQFGQPTPPVLPIVGGELVEAGEYPEVVGLDIGGFGCTGVLVAPRLVLTAAHCVVNRFEDEIIRVHTGVEATGPEEALASSFGAHPEFNPDPSASDVFDYGFVVTDRDLPGPYAVPITSQEAFDFAMQYDREVTVVGYGKFDSEQDEDLLKRSLTLPITGFSRDGLEFFAGGGGKDTCDGDSGGPVYVEMADGSRRLAGLVSRGSEVCGSRGIYSVPHAGLCFVRDESGIDATGACSTCDCIDTTPPPPPDEGCGRCTASAPQPASVFALLLLGLSCVRRRRLGGLRTRRAARATTSGSRGWPLAGARASRV